MKRIKETLVFVCVIAAAVAAGYGICVNTGVTAGIIKAGKAIVEKTSPAEAGRYTFDTELMKEINFEETGKSFVFSPYSIKDCITLTYDGMNAGAKKELSSLGLTDNAVKSIISFDKKVKGLDTLKIANRAFFDKKKATGLNTDLIRKDGSGYIDVTDNNRAANKINSWISENTGNKINGLVEPDAINKDTNMLLCNAVWMNMKWKEEDLYSEDDREILWHTSKAGRTEEYKGFSGALGFADAKEKDGVKIGRLRYDSPKGLDLYMYVILPDKNTETAIDDWLKKNHDYEDLLDFSDYKGLKGYTDADFSLPDFISRYQNENMKESLKKIGLDEKFTDTYRNRYKTYDAFVKKKPGAKGIYVSAVMHGAYVKTSIKGTEAAAATVEGFSDSMTALPPREEKHFHLTCDHPFIYIIKDENSGQILFMGKVMRDSMTRSTDSFVKMEEGGTKQTDTIPSILVPDEEVKGEKNRDTQNETVAAYSTPEEAFQGILKKYKKKADRDYKKIMKDREPAESHDKISDAEYKAYAAVQSQEAKCYKQLKKTAGELKRRKMISDFEDAEIFGKHGIMVISSDGMACQYTPDFGHTPAGLQMN